MARNVKREAKRTREAGTRSKPPKPEKARRARTGANRGDYKTAGGTPIIQKEVDNS